MSAKTKTGSTKRGFAALEAVFFTTAALIAFTSLAAYLKMSAQGRMKSQADAYGTPFSPAWSNYSTTTHVYERTKNSVSPTGETESVLLDDAITDQRGYFDDFSNKGIDQESLYQ